MPKSRRPDRLVYLKEKETTIIELLCLVPTRRVGTLIFPWRPAIARVLRERRPHLCSLPQCHDGSGRGTVLAPCAEGYIIFFLCVLMRRLFSPTGPFLFPGARYQCIRNQAARRAGGRVDKTIDSCWVFFGGVLLGIMFAEHDAPPRFNSLRHGSVGTVVFFYLTTLSKSNNFSPF